MIPRMGNRPWRRLLAAALAAAAIVALWSHLAERSERALARDLGLLATSESDHRSWGNSVGFVDERRLDEHYRKHGAEFGHITKLDYLHQAQLLRDTAVGGPVLETMRHDGVTTRFDRQTGAFVAFNRDGTIRTFFKPNDGERYYRRQAERSE
jgi:pyocin large subunit-like protein